jgi:hypothetical protein
LQKLDTLNHKPVTTEKYMDIEGPIRITWRLPASQVSTEREALLRAGGVVETEQRFEPSDEERDRQAHAQFEPLTIVVCSIACTYLAERLTRLVKGLSHGGLIIDLRTDPITVREEGALDYGTVYVVSKAGVQQVSRPNSTDILAAIKAAER